MALRDELIAEIISVGMLRRDVATDIAAAIMRKFDVGYARCGHERRRRVHTEVGDALLCVACGHQEFV